MIFDALSYVVTLHPFDEQEYTELILGVVSGRHTPDDLVARYATDARVSELVSTWVPRMREALGSLRAGDGIPWSAAVNFMAGVLNAHVHPAWFVGDVGLSYWRFPGECPLRPFTRSMAVMAARVPDIGAAVSEIREGFAGPMTAGSYVSSADLTHFMRELEQRPINYADPLRAAGYDPLEVLPVVLETLYYARERRLAVLEVTHALDPATGYPLFPVENLRGGQYGRLNPEVRERIARTLATQEG